MTRIRLPLQQRTRESWNRILDAGVAILIEEGRDALTIQATCRRARVSPPTLYARVDGISGLFWAIYDREMTRIVATYRQLLRRAELTPEGSRQRIAALVDTVCGTFREHEVFLHQIINISVSVDGLRERGSRESLALVERVAALLPRRPRGAAPDVARMLLQECRSRAMYGNRWLSRKPESYQAFRRRLMAMAMARFGQRT